MADSGIGEADYDDEEGLYDFVANPDSSSGLVFERKSIKLF